MTTFDLGWLIGIFEGEGNFYLTPDRRGLVAKVSMSDVDVIQRVAQLVGKPRGVRGYMPAAPRPKRDRSKMYEVALSGHEAAKLMMTFLPHMGARRSQKLLHHLDTWAPVMQGRGMCKQCAAWIVERDAA